MLAEHGPAALHETIERFVEIVTAAAAEEAVDWLDTDVGVGSLKLLLAAGAPRAVDDDERRMLVTLRRIIDECPRPTRAGAQRGRVFASTLGVGSDAGTPCSATPSTSPPGHSASPTSASWWWRTRSTWRTSPACSTRRSGRTG